MYALNKETISEEVLEVLPAATPAADLGVVATSGAKDVVARDPEDCAAGKVEHLLRVFEGTEDKFRFYGVFDEPHHKATFEAMNTYLGIPNCEAKDLPPERMVIMTGPSGAALVRWSNVGPDNVPFDVYYQTFHPHELEEMGLDPSAPELT